MASSSDFDADAEIARIKNASSLYDVLRISKDDATDETVKKAYRKLALRLHPDKCSSAGTEEAFKAVSAAFKGLETVQSRRMYDMTGSSDSSGGGGTPFSTDGMGLVKAFITIHIFNWLPSPDASDIFAHMFEEIRRQHQSGRLVCMDVLYTVVVLIYHALINNLNVQASTRPTAGRSIWKRNALCLRTRVW